MMPLIEAKYGGGFTLEHSFSEVEISALIEEKPQRNEIIMADRKLLLKTQKMKIIIVKPYKAKIMSSRAMQDFDGPLSSCFLRS